MLLIDHVSLTLLVSSIDTHFKLYAIIGINTFGMVSKLDVISPISTASHQRQLWSGKYMKYSLVVSFDLRCVYFVLQMLQLVLFVTH